MTVEQEAIVRGEFHASNIDRRALLNRDLSDFQALFVEGRSDDIQLCDKSTIYFIFAIGYMNLNAFYKLIGQIYSNLLPFWEYDFIDEARSSGLEVEDEIDLEIYEIYDRVGYTFAVGSLVSLFAFGILLSINPAFNQYVTIFGINTPIPTWVTAAIFWILFPFLYTGIMVSYGESGDRDEKMSKSVNSLSKNRGYDKVLILVGDRHVDSVAKNLDAIGWSTTKEPSQHPIAKLQRFIFE